MFSSSRAHLVTFLVVLFFGLPYISENYSVSLQKFADMIGNATLQTAAIVLHNPRTITELQAKYASTSPASSTIIAKSDSLPPMPSKVRILLVPGHEPSFGGTEFGALKERTMNTELASNLLILLKDDPHFEAFKTRNNEAWDPTFAQYFKDQWSAIKQWQKDSHKELLHLIAVGSTTAAVSKVFHNIVPTDVALRLYGITKWANENRIDVVIHIHFNDLPDHRVGVSGLHSGFAIYVPVGQFSNSTTTKAVANALFKRLRIYNKVSNLPGESSGIVDEPDLIAIGANNTADAASMLIEYGYIYEPQFTGSASLRSAALKDLAQQTYLGLKDFFESPSAF